MWNGKRTKELSDLYDQYYQKFHCEPDWYDEILYDQISYDEFVSFIKTAIETDQEFPDVVT